MMKKTSISVYNPKDPWEQEIMSAYHEFHPNDDWLPSFACQQAAKAILNLKTAFWADQSDLRRHRARYFFSPAMTAHKDEMVFVSYPLFAQDILENESINVYLHDPIVFVTKPIAHYLLHDYPVHLVVKWDTVVADNHDNRFLDVGGMYLACGKNVVLRNSAIISMHENSLDRRKTASSLVGKDVYRIDEHHRDLRPATEVYDKEKRVWGEIEEVGIGEKGIIRVTYRDGSTADLSQDEFDLRYLITEKTASQNVTVPLLLNGQMHQLNERQISKIIKRRLMQSKTIRKLFDDFEISPERLQDLQIVIADLDQKYAETDLNTMKLDVSLFAEGKFLEANFFVVCHELVHWLSREKESRSYWNDPEEVLGFVSSIAYELDMNTPLPQIYDKIYNKVNWHFHDESDAQTFMKRMVEKAKRIQNS